MIACWPEYSGNVAIWQSQSTQGEHCGMAFCKAKDQTFVSPVILPALLSTNSIKDEYL